MQIVKKSNRKAISPVLATVILIAITLIAAIAIAGFVFGLFGTFTNTAQISASAQVCQESPPLSGNEVCSLVLSNTGNAAVLSTASCSITWGGSGHVGVYSPVASVVPGSTQVGTCTVTGATATAGLQVTGFVIMANGANALWSTTSS